MSTLAELTPADQALKSTVHAGLFITFVAAAAGFYVTKIQKTENIRIPLGGSFNISTDLDKKFKRDYLVAYLLAMLADWLQGPYVYALYAFYGFSKADNGLLFIFGFGSSAIFGTFIGGFADKYGRKKFTIMYGVIYALSCCTKHFNNFTILVVGRLLAGIATSLLYSRDEFEGSGGAASGASATEQAASGADTNQTVNLGAAQTTENTPKSGCC